MVQITKMRLPTYEEWDRLVDITDGANGLMHWNRIYSWCKDVQQSNMAYHSNRGFYSASTWHNNYSRSRRSAFVGFRPVIEFLGPGALPDGSTVVIGTFYIDGQPVRIPKNPTYSGDIPDYIPDTKLALRAPIQDAAYQVKAIKMGNILIADRVLIKDISLYDLYDQGIC